MTRQKPHQKSKPKRLQARETILSVIVAYVPLLHFMIEKYWLLMDLLLPTMVLLIGCNVENDLCIPVTAKMNYYISASAVIYSSSCFWFFLPKELLYFSESDLIVWILDFLPKILYRAFEGWLSYVVGSTTPNNQVDSLEHSGCIVEDTIRGLLLTIGIYSRHHI